MQVQVHFDLILTVECESPSDIDSRVIRDSVAEAITRQHNEIGLTSDDDDSYVSEFAVSSATLVAPGSQH